LPDQAHGGDRLLVVDRQHLDIVLAQDLEIDRADQGAQAVADRVRHEWTDATAPLQGLERIGGTGGFRSDHLAARGKCRRGNRTAADQSATANRCDQHVEWAGLGKQFHRSRALSGNNAQVGVGMHEGRAGLQSNRFGGLFACADACGATMHGGTVGLDRLDLRADCALRNDHVGRNAARAGGQRQCSTMIAG
jgi:hypothetical protein